MVSIKLYHDTRACNGKPAPVKIVICFERKTAYHPTGVKVTPSQWDARGGKVVRHPQKMYLNAILTARLYEWESALIRLTESGQARKACSAIGLRDMILAFLDPEAAQRAERKRKGDFVPAFRAFAETRRTEGNREAYRRTLARMEAYDPELATRTFKDIGKEWLRGFEAFMARTAKSANARAFHLRNIRAVFNEAIDDEKTTFYPFRKFKILHSPTPKRSLTVEQLRTLATYPCEPYQERHRDMFMLMFTLIGINGVDLFAAKPGDVMGGRLEYVRAKTHKPYSIKIEPEAAELLERLKGERYLVWVGDTYADYRDYLTRMARSLKQIGPVTRHGLGGKKEREPLFPAISQYWCRHTWATVAASLDVPKETIAAALGHGGNTVTDIYIDFDRRKVDEANRRVLDWVFHGLR